MVLVDSSVWIGYFRGEKKAKHLDHLIETNTACVNDLIFAELLPSIAHKNEPDLRELLLVVQRIPLVIRWDHIISMQTANLKNGINKVGIPDLIIMQNAQEHSVPLFTLDRHFALMSKIHGITLYEV